MDSHPFRSRTIDRPPMVGPLFAIALCATSTATETATITATATVSPRQLVRRYTLTSTAFVATIKPTFDPRTKVEHRAPPPKPPPDRIEGLLAGMHLEYAIFQSPFLASRMMQIDARQPDSGELSEVVLLFGFGFTGEWRIFEYLAFAPGVTYLFTPRFFNVTVETDGTIETELSFAHALSLGGRFHGYVPLSGWTDLVIGTGPSMIHARFRGRGETALGIEGRLGFQFHTDDLPDARLLGVLRYAPIDFGDGVELDLTGLALVADVVFDL